MAQLFSINSLLENEETVMVIASDMKEAIALWQAAYDETDEPSSIAYIDDTADILGLKEFIVQSALGIDNEEEEEEKPDYSF